MRVRFAEQISSACDEAQESGDGNVREEIGRCHAFTPGRDRILPLRRANIGTAAEKCIDIAERQCLSDRRIRTRRKIDLQLARALADEHGDPMLAAGHRRSNRRQARFDRRHACGRAGDIELLADSCIAPDSGEAQRLALVAETLLRHGELLLQSAELEVISRHFGGHDHAHIFQRGIEALGIRRRSAHRRTDAAEYIQLPERIEASAIGRDLARLVGEAWDHLFAFVEGGICSDDRITIERHIAERRARLIEPRDGDADVMVRLQRVVLEALQHWIVEVMPPVRVVSLLREQRRVGSRVPRLDLRSVIRTQRAAAEEQRDEDQCCDLRNENTPLAVTLDQIADECEEHRRQEESERRHAEHAGEDCDSHRAPNLESCAG